MLIKRLLHARDIDRFIAFNLTNGGSPVAPTYLEGANVWVFSRPTNPNDWVAAYVINARPPFRCLSPLDPPQRTEALREHGLCESSLAEITLLSRNRSQSWLPGERDYYYRMSVIDALRMGKRHILGGTTDPDLLRFQQIALDQVLYEGDLPFFGQTRHVWLVYASWFRVLANAGRYVLGQLLSSRRASRQPVPGGSWQPAKK